MGINNQLLFRRRPHVRECLDVADSTLDNYIRDGIWPPPFKLGLRAVAWLDHENNTVLAAMAAGKPKEEIREIVSDLVSKRPSILESYQQSTAEILGGFHDEK